MFSTAEYQLYQSDISPLQKKTATKKNVHSYKYKSLKQNFLLDQYVKSHTVREMPPVTPCTFYFKHFPAPTYTPLAFSSLVC